VLGLWASKRLVVVANRVPGGVLLARYDLPRGRRTVVWRGARLGPVAVGGGTVATVEGARRVLASRSGALRRVRTAGGNVAALAVDGRRLATFERIVLKKGGRRVTAVRIARIGA
jgi:hypothetical protein